MPETLTHVTQGSVKLGCNHKLNLKALPLSNYVNPKAMAFPPVCAWWRPMEFGMLGNDRVGDCVIAYMLHQIKVWRSVARAAEVPSFSDEQAIKVYSDITGYDPENPSTDQGTDPDAALSFWQKNTLFGYKIDAYANLDISNIDQLKYAIWTFGGIGFSFQVPRYIMDVPGGGSWSYRSGLDITIQGGHQVGVIDYGRQGFRENCWNTTNTFDPNFIERFGVAAQAAVSEDWIKASGISPSGLDLDSLLKDAQLI